MAGKSPTTRRSRTDAPSDPLIPIRLDLTHESHRVQDTFLWNALETETTPSTFAALLAADLNLPDTLCPIISAAITDQIAAHTPPPPPRAEARHVVRLNVRVGRVVVRDQFEWDLSSRANSPEAFAERLCADLGLRTEHVPLVAYAIREQLIEMAQFQDVRQRCRVLSPREAVRQGAVDAWAPSVDCLTTEEQERLERKEKREARLMRRNKGKAEVYGKPIRRRRSSGDASRRR